MLFRHLSVFIPVGGMVSPAAGLQLVDVDEIPRVSLNPPTESMGSFVSVGAAGEVVMQKIQETKPGGSGKKKGKKGKKCGYMKKGAVCPGEGDEVEVAEGAKGFKACRHACNDPASECKGFQFSSGSCTVFKELDESTDADGECSKESCCLVHKVDMDVEGDEVVVGVEVDDEDVGVDEDPSEMLLQLQGWQQEALDKHNQLRANHVDTPEMTWSSAMEASAQEWANRGQFEHSDCYNIPPPAGPSGENLAMGHGSITAAIQDWYDEVDNCVALPGCETSKGGMIGHFTAMVWAGATELGCGQAGNLYVCRYRGGDTRSCTTPNMGGCYKDNVKVKGQSSGPAPTPTPDPGATFTVGSKNSLSCNEGSPVASEEDCEGAAAHFDVAFGQQVKNKGNFPSGCSQANSGKVFWNTASGKAHKNRRVVCTGGDDMPPEPPPAPTPPAPTPPAPTPPAPTPPAPTPPPSGGSGGGCATPDPVGPTRIVLNGSPAYCSELGQFCGGYSFVRDACPCTCEEFLQPTPAPPPRPPGSGGECCACSQTSDCADGAFCCPYMKKCSFSGTSCYTGSDCDVASAGNRR